MRPSSLSLSHAVAFALQIAPNEPLSTYINLAPTLHLNPAQTSNLIFLPLFFRITNRPSDYISCTAITMAAARALFVAAVVSMAAVVGTTAHGASYTVGAPSGSWDLRTNYTRWASGINFRAGDQLGT